MLHFTSNCTVVPSVPLVSSKLPKDYLTKQAQNLVHETSKASAECSDELAFIKCLFTTKNATSAQLDQAEINCQYAEMYRVEAINYLNEL